VPASWLAAHLRPPLVVLDAAVILPPPARDGDNRPRSGREQLAAAHIPAARHADLLDAVLDQCSGCRAGWRLANVAGRRRPGRVRRAGQSGGLID
jgi:hypothetical protein